MLPRLLLTALAALALAACSGTSPTRKSGAETTPAAAPGSAEAAVAQRAQERWQALISKDFRKAYQYLTAGTRTTTPEDAYVRRMANVNIRWTGSEVTEVVCEDAEVCRATVKINYTVRPDHMGMPDMEASAPVYERWLLGDGQWYYLPERTGN